MGLRTTNQYGTNNDPFAGRGRVSLINGFNNSLNVRYFFIADGTAIAGAAPITDMKQAIAVGPGANFSWTPSPQCSQFAVGCTWGVSDTAATFTQSTDSFFVHTEAEVDAP
jgi:hypothetical protein